MTSSKLELSPQRATFAAEYVMQGDGAKAARAAGYAHPKQSAYKLLRNPAVVAQIDNLRTRSSLQTGLTIAEWFEGLWEATDEARKAGAWGAVMRGYELQGRHIGAFKNETRLDEAEKRVYTFLGAAMEREAERANSGEVSGEDSKGITPLNTLEGTARILE